MSSRPVVAHVLNSIGLGGVPEVAWQLLRRLPDDRFDQRVYALRRAEGEEETRAARVARIEERGVPVSFADASGSLGVVAHLCDWLVSNRVDLVHTHSYRPNLQGRLAAVPLRPGGLRIVAHYHNRYDDKWAKEGTRALERALTAATDRVVACSAAAGEHVAASLGVPAERVAVIPNGVEAERFARAARVSSSPSARRRAYTRWSKRSSGRRRMSCHATSGTPPSPIEFRTWATTGRPLMRAPPRTAARSAGRVARGPARGGPS